MTELELKERQNILNDAFRKIESVVYDLSDLAIAFLKIGNESVGNELDNDATYITRNLRIIREEMEKRVVEEFNRCEQASANMLNGIMTGIELGRKGK